MNDFNYLYVSTGSYFVVGIACLIEEKRWWRVRRPKGHRFK